jgi:hypothetical protein
MGEAGMGKPGGMQNAECRITDWEGVGMQNAKYKMQNGRGGGGFKIRIMIKIRMIWLDS